MNLTEIEEIRYNKFSKQHALDTFSHNYTNKFDRPIDNLIKSLKQEVEKKSEKYKFYENLQNERSEEFWKLQDKLDPSGYGVDMAMMDLLQDMVYLEEEILAVCETKIIYSFKHFEISLKKLLRIAFGENENLRKYKWHELINFFRQKNIELSRLNGFSEVDQLRELNNTLKHSNENINDQIKQIEEFKNKEYFVYSQLINFYDRIKTFPELFLASLSSEIQKYLYDFDDKRIENIANAYALRMDKKDAEKFIATLKAKY